MAPNTIPIYTGTPQTWIGVSLLTANTATDGTGTVQTLLTSNATNGSWVDRIRLHPLGTNVASVLRIFINNGGATSVATNNALWDEVPLPVTTAANAAVIGPTLEVTMSIGLTKAYLVTLCIGTTVAGGWIPIAAGGDF